MARWWRGCRAGAGGIIGAELVAKSAPDGYTLLVTSISHTINPSVVKTLPFDTQRDFAPVMLIADAPNILVVHPSVPAGSLAASKAFDLGSSVSGKVMTADEMRKALSLN